MRFEAWATMGGPLTEVDFIRRLAIQRPMRAMFVVPVDERKKLATACAPSVRDEDSSRTLILDRLEIHEPDVMRVFGRDHAIHTLGFFGYFRFG